MIRRFIFLLLLSLAVKESEPLSPLSLIEISNFIGDNGLRTITILRFQNVRLPESLLVRFLARSSTCYARIMSHNEIITTESGSFVIVIDTKKEDMSLIFTMIAQFRVKSSLLILTKRADLAILKNQLKLFKDTSYFYVAVTAAAAGVSRPVEWFQVITLSSGYSMNKVKFHHGNGFLIDESHFDLSGLTIRSISLAWKPYLDFIECNGGSCKSVGFLKDVMDIVASQLNFTYESYKESKIFLLFPLLMF